MSKKRRKEDQQPYDRSEVEQRFDQLCKAIIGEVCMVVDCEDPLGRLVPVACEVRQIDTGLLEFVPLSIIITGDPMKQFYPPEAITNGEDEPFDLTPEEEDS